MGVGVPLAPLCGSACVYVGWEVAAADRCWSAPCSAPVTAAGAAATVACPVVPLIVAGDAALHASGHRLCCWLWDARGCGSGAGGILFGSSMLAQDARPGAGVVAHLGVHVPEHNCSVPDMLHVPRWQEDRKSAAPGYSWGTIAALDRSSCRNCLRLRDKVHRTLFPPHNGDEGREDKAILL